MRLITMGYKKFSFLAFAVIFGACQNEIKVQRAQGDALGTTYSILYADTKANESVLDSIDAIFLRMNQSMSTYWPNSIISKINRGEAVVADADFKNVFRASKLVWQQTNGYFDPTVGALVNAYGFGPEKPLAEIDAKTVDSLLNITGFQRVSLEENGTVSKENKNIYFDFNAIAKGYTVDALATMLTSLGYENYLVEVGGELFAAGINPDKEIPWRVAIDHPEQRETRAFIATLPLQNQGLASSGNYRKFRTDEAGNSFVHTVNPITGKSIKSNILSTSVLASTTMLADAYATALMAMPFEKGKILIETLNDIEAAWVLAINDSVQVITTPNFTFELE
ncbi:MAG: FAD:protein FMN transferase [Bacteroidota bacterium]|nr:MAG: FAD:protein FMN transferase [Bacteroidota bacterium]